MEYPRQGFNKPEGTHTKGAFAAANSYNEGQRVALRRAAGISRRTWLRSRTAADDSRCGTRSAEALFERLGRGLERGLTVVA